MKNKYQLIISGEKNEKKNVTHEKNIQTSQTVADATCLPVEDLFCFFLYINKIN